MVKKVHADLVEETTLTTGDSDPYALEGALDGKQSFDVFTDGDTVFVAVTLGSAFEIVEGIFTSSGRTVSRVRVLASSNSGSKVDWPAGTKTIRQVAPAELINGLAGYQNPSVAGDATNPGVEIGEHGTGLFHIVDSVNGWDALCFSMDTEDHFRLYKKSDRIAMSLGWAFDNNVPGFVAPSHQYTGTVAHLYGTTSTLLLSGTEDAAVVFNDTGSSNCYRLHQDGGLKLERINKANGSVEETLFSYFSNGTFDFGNAKGISAANFQNSNGTNTQVGYLAGDDLPFADSFEVTAIGNRALLIATTYFNQVTAIGSRAMEGSIASGPSAPLNYTTMVGAYSGRYCQASSNTGIGYRAVGGAPSGGGNATGEGNVGIGADALYQLTSGETNTCVGTDAGNQLTSGSGCVFVGFQAGQHLGNVSDRLAIGNGPTAGDCLLIGDFDAQEVTLNADVNVTGSLTNNGLDLAAVAKGSYGYRISNNTTDADHDLDIAAGASLSWDRTTWIAGAALTKRFDAAWAAGNGNGGIDTGSIPTSGGLYLYAIYHPSSGVDYIGSTAAPATGPSLPTGYTKYAYIGYRPTDSSANFLPVVQKGNYHEFQDEILAEESVNPGTSDNDVTCPVPDGAVVMIYMFLRNTNTGNSLSRIYFGTTEATAAIRRGFVDPANGIIYDSQSIAIITASDSNQVRYRVDASFATLLVALRITGWVDHDITGLGT